MPSINIKEKQFYVLDFHLERILLSASSALVVPSVDCNKLERLALLPPNSDSNGSLERRLRRLKENPNLTKSKKLRKMERTNALYATNEQLAALSPPALSLPLDDEALI
jgi:hypothetical protein